MGLLQRTEYVLEESRRHGLRAALPLVSVSYCWLSKKHPDPQGKQLQVLASHLAALVQYLTEEHGNRGFQDCGVFVDWCSLYQRPRSPEETKSFVRGLRGAGLLFGHQLIWKLLLTRPPKSGARITQRAPYEKRGWPFFERAVSSLLTAREHVLDLGLATNASNCSGGQALVDSCVAARRPPQTPPEFDDCMDSKVLMLDGDRDFLKRNYRKLFNTVMEGVESLDYSCHGWGHEEMQLLGASLCSCVFLRTLLLGNNCVGDRGLGMLVQGLLHLCALEVLDLTSNNIGDLGAQRIAVALPILVRLRVLVLHSNHVAAVGASGLAEALPQCPSLSELKLGENRLGDPGAVCLAQVLSLCNLRCLDLCGNCIGDDGVIELAKALPKCRSLEQLLLGTNRIADAGAEALADAVPQCKRLERLVLASNDVGDRGAALLAKALPACSMLTVLSLSGNRLSDNAAECFAEAMPSTPRLKLLHIDGNLLSPVSRDMLHSARRNSGKPRRCMVDGETFESLLV
uniref:Uncharacterized protein n=1 Tax=Pyrodinium bahamense TaxID=73915 RepID=A0A7S0AYJ7_9DINO|mmetsp:Transcript_44961/g.125036  ORF Transcript_44961/g.125036 Transcript_44961/m.125036 type:complete len:515 (+) Transcript_44961:470-2014(+)